MKKIKPYLCALIAVCAMLWSNSAQSQTAQQLLKDKNKKQEIFSAIINDSALSKEFMGAMMKDAKCCKRMMGDDGMMKMMMNDSTKMHNMICESKEMQGMMMKQMMDMCAKDTSMCKNMMQMMKEKPDMMQMMKGMNSNTNMPAGSTVYTCPMHPEITSSKPGKCPKCGMELVKKPADKMKMP